MACPHAGADLTGRGESERSAWWGGLWADRITSSRFGEQAIEQGLATAADLADLADAWRRWSSEDDGWFAVLHGEIRALV